MIVIASMQKHAMVTTTDNVCPCLCAIMGLGGVMFQ